MLLALNMAKMAKEGITRAAIEEKKYLIKKPSADVRAEKMLGVEFPGYKKVLTVIQRDPAMRFQNQMSGSFPCQNITAKNPQTRWRRKETGPPPPS